MANIILSASKKELHATQKPKPPSRRQRCLLVFRLADQRYALPLAEVQEILPIAMLARPPRLPSILAGFLNLAGEAVPVVRLACLFELPDQPASLYTPLVILRNPDRRLALVVERVSGVVAVSDDAVVPVQEDDSFNGSTEAQVTVTDHVIHILAPDRILLEKERQCLAEFQAM